MTKLGLYIQGERTNDTKKDQRIWAGGVKSTFKVKQITRPIGFGGEPQFQIWHNYNPFTRTEYRNYLKVKYAAIQFEIEFALDGEFKYSDVFTGNEQSGWRQRSVNLSCIPAVNFSFIPLKFSGYLVKQKRQPGISHDWTSEVADVPIIDISSKATASAALDAFNIGWYRTVHYPSKPEDQSAVVLSAGRVTGQISFEVQVKFHGYKVAKYQYSPVKGVIGPGKNKILGSWPINGPKEPTYVDTQSN
jgi:hypothetical protein